MATKIAIAGAAGRMGRRIIALASSDAAFKLVGAFESPGSEFLGRDAGDLAGIGHMGLAVTIAPPGEFDVLIDFSSPAGTIQWIGVCQEARRALVIGTTGHEESAIAKLRSATKAIPILKAANMSVGVNLMLRLVQQAAAALDGSYDIEIVEAHHRFKVDAPSGTALAIRDAVNAGRADAGKGPGNVVHGRQGNTGERKAGEIGMHALRIGDTVGEHTISFGALGETISISHSAHSRDTFAGGALRAAAWISGKQPGLYDMQDVLFGRA